MKITVMKKVALMLVQALVVTLSLL
jgi:ubiquitin